MPLWSLHPETSVWNPGEQHMDDQGQAKVKEFNKCHCASL